MLIRLVGGAIASLIALGALLAPSPAPVEAASSSCTGWASSIVPPPSIRVLRTATKRTQVVDFRLYVEKVMPAEWGASHPAAALKAGAVAIKQYAWYYAMAGHWRGGKDATGHCYDVRDDARDQVYSPSKIPARTHLAAVAATWSWAVRRADSLILTGYRPGSSSCPGPVDGYRLYQLNASACARKGWSAEQILRVYFSPASRPAAIVIPGQNDMTADGRGDAAGVLTDPSTGETTVRLYTADPSVSATGVAAASARILATVEAGALIGRSTADTNADGRLDIVSLVAGPDDTVALEVMAATGSGFAPATTWWTSGTGQFVPGELTLVAGDFNADGLGDAGLLVRRADPAYTGLWLARSTGVAFSAPIRRMSVDRDLTAATVAAGDFTGDGRRDLAFLLPDGPAETATATRIEVAASGRVDNGVTTLYLTPPVPWLVEPAAPGSIKVAVGDVDRTGRDDLFLVRRSGDAIKVLAARSTGSAFSRRWVYTDTTDPIPWASAKPVASDVTGDGRTDLLLLVDRGRDDAGASLGIAIIRLRSFGTYLGARSLWKSDPTSDWSAVNPH
jgi:Stage II sporulation protein